MTPFFVFFRVVAARRSSCSLRLPSLSGLEAFSHFHLKLGGVVPVRERRAFVRIERGRGVLKSASQDGAGRSGGR